MKTYQSSTKDKKKKNFFMRNIYAILLGITVVAIGLIVTLTLVLTHDTPASVTPPPIDDGGSDVNGGGDKPTFVMPVGEYTLGQGAALNNLVYSSTLKQWRTHNGVDFMAAAGSDVRAVTDGTVTKVENTMLEGTVVTITHADGVVTVYKSLDSTVSVESGQTVKSGDKIGTIANSMMIEQLEGPHLHLEMQVNGSYVNPMDYLPGGSDK